MIPSPDLLEWLRELPSRRALHMLRLIAALFLKHGERGWDASLTEAARRLAPLHDDDHPAETTAVMQNVLGFFDGEASLRRVYLSDQSGHKIKPDDVEAVNARLSALVTQLYLSARQAIARLRWRQR